MAKSFKNQVSIIQKKWGKTIFIGLGIIFLFFFLRLINLTILPIFCDEAIYIRWAQVMKSEPTLRFLPLSDGKQPLFMWLMIPFFKFFTDPLVAGRMLSVLSGLASLVGLFLLTYYLFKSQRAALIAILFYTLLPFTFFFDRMALVDSFLLAFGIWILFLSVLLVEYQRIDLAILTGIVLGGGLITKSPAMFFVGLIPTTILLLNFQKKKLAIQIFKLVGLWLIVYVFAFAIYNLLRLGPEFQMIALRNKDYVFSIGEILSHPHNPLLVHLKDIIDWFPNLFTWPILVVSGLGLVIGLTNRNKWRLILILLAWFLVPLLAQSAVAKVFTPRYLLYTIFPLIIFVSLFFEFLFNKFKRYKLIITFLILIILILPLRYDYLLITNPQVAHLPERMRTGYLEEWTAGTGIKEAAEYFKDQAKSKKILVGTEGYFGTLPDGLQIYLERAPNITIIGIGLYPEQVPEPLISGLIDNDVYLLINDERLNLVPQQHHLALIKSYPKVSRPDGTRQNLLLLRLEQENE